MENFQEEDSLGKIFYGSFQNNNNDDKKSEEANSIIKSNDNKPMKICCTPKEQIQNSINNIEQDIKQFEKETHQNIKNIKDILNNLKKYASEYIISENDSSLININKNMSKISYNFKNIVNKNENEEISEKNERTFINYNSENKINELIGELHININKFNDIYLKFNNDFKLNFQNIKFFMEESEKSIKASFNTSETKLDISYQIKRNIFIKDARCHFGLDNQFEVIKYNDENHLLIYIDNLNDLILKIFNKNNEIIKIYVHKKLFDDVIREIRYFSKKYGYDEKKYLLVSSRNNELKIFEIKIDSENFQDILIEINHIANIYTKESQIINGSLYDISSSVIRFDKNLDDSQIITTTWEGNSIKIYNLFYNKCIKEIISETSCNIKYCNIIDNDYLIFCGCNNQDKYTCANLIDLEELEYNNIKDKNVRITKFRDESKENKENVFFHFITYHCNYNNEKYLIICDEKGYIRIFNFTNHLLIQKIMPSDINKNIKYKNEGENKIKRLNSILLYNYNHCLITERNTGYVYDININYYNNRIELNIDKYFNLFDKKIISIRKYGDLYDKTFLAIGKNSIDNVIEKENIICFNI